MKPQEAFPRMLELLKRLRDARISFSLRQSRDDAILIDVDLPDFIGLSEIDSFKQSFHLLRPEVTNLYHKYYSYASASTGS